jgi:hypothetical protein
MRNFLYVISLFLFFVSCDEIQKIIDNTAESTGKKTETESDKKNTGLRENYYPNGELKSSVNYKDGVKHGVAKNYYENGNLKLAMTYENGKKTGASYFYYEDGQLYRESIYKNDKLDGVRKVYADGKLKSEVIYKNGYPSKGLKEYLLNGKLKTKYPGILIKPIDKRLIDGSYTLDIYFSESHQKDEFYIGKLAEGNFVHDGLEKVITDRGHGKITFFVPPGGFVMKQLNIVGVHTTKQGNPFVSTRTYNLSIE